VSKLLSLQWTGTIAGFVFCPGILFFILAVFFSPLATDQEKTTPPPERILLAV
jgi:hypothetical protein